MIFCSVVNNFDVSLLFMSSCVFVRCKYILFDLVQRYDVLLFMSLCVFVKCKCILFDLVQRYHVLLFEKSKQS